MSASLQAGTKEKPIMPIRTLPEAISHYGHDAYLLTVAQDGPQTSYVPLSFKAVASAAPWVRPPPGTSRASPTYHCSGRLRSPAATP